MSLSDIPSPTRPPFAVILGTNEIASAVAVQLYRDGYAVVLSHDPTLPVLRRKMSFHDALFDDAAEIDGVVARLANSTICIQRQLAQRDGVLVTNLGLLDIIVVRPFDILVDARMQKHRFTPELRGLGRYTIGLGPGFCTHVNCDVAIETKPGQAGQIVREGATATADGVPPLLGGYGEERFVRAANAGRWRTAVEIGARVYKDYVVGSLNGDPVATPFDGMLRGSVRDGTETPAGAKLIEIDARGRNANCVAFEARERAIAKAVATAIATRDRPNVKKSRLHLVRDARIRQDDKI